MAVECKCEACEAMIKADAAPGSGIACPQCQRPLIVPEPCETGDVPVATTAEDDEVLGYIDWRGVLQRSLPWAVSIALHGVLLLIMAYIAWSSISEDTRTRIMTPSMVEADPGGTLTPGPEDDLEPARMDEETLLPTEPDTQLDASLLQNPLTAISTTAQSTSQLTSALTQGPPSDAAPVGRLWEVGNSGQGGPPSRFMNTGGQAHNICYVIDRSGSMTGAFEYVKKEMFRSIKELQPGQMFHVIFFSHREPIEMKYERLVHANDLHKAQAIRFIRGMVEAGRTDPRPALRRAFALNPRPELIYFLTDGSFDPEVLEEIRKWNPGAKTQINTIAFLRRPGEALLRQIARENNGEYIYINPERGLAP